MTAAAPNTSAVQRGAGGEIPPSPTPPGTKHDPTLVARALRQQWHLPESLYRLLPLEMLHIVTARDAQQQPVYKPRERIQAARVLAVLHAQNEAQHAAQHPAPQTHLHAHEHRHTLSLDDCRQAYLARLDPPGDGGRSA